MAKRRPAEPGPPDPRDREGEGLERDDPTPQVSDMLDLATAYIDATVDSWMHVLELQMNPEPDAGTGGGPANYEEGLVALPETRAVDRPVLPYGPLPIPPTPATPPPRPVRTPEPDLRNRYRRLSLERAIRAAGAPPDGEGDDADEGPR